MTLQDFFNKVQSDPSLVMHYFLILLVLTIIAIIFSKNEGDLSPWKYLYSGIIYLVCVPGIFAITLSIYFFLFERRSIMQTDLLIQVLPIVSMIATLLIIKRNVSLDNIPGFDRLSGLMTIITITLSLLWIIDRTHIYAIAFVPFTYILIFIGVAILLMRYSFKKMAN